MNGTKTETTTRAPRRAILAGAGAALAAAALAGTKAASAATAPATGPNPDAELIAACDRFTALEHKRRMIIASATTREAEKATEPLLDEIHAEQADLLDQIAEMQAASFDGIRARVRMIYAADCPCFADCGDWDDQMIGALMHDLKRVLA